MNSTDKKEHTHSTPTSTQWKTFGSFVQKEFYHITRDRTTLALLLILPVLLMILFGFSINTEVKNSQIAIYDPSNDVATRGIIEKIKASEYFTVVRMLNNPAEIEKQFLKDDLKMATIFMKTCSAQEKLKSSC